jgi:RHS repeat-associated protein
VGGLLAVDIGGQLYFPCYDNNGNVTEYVDATGSIRARYEYSPFGKITVQSGDLADTFRFRFSTKYYDIETQSYYYGYRHYMPKFGCWFNRDPIEEQGGLNLQGFIGNNPINLWDYLGLVGKTEVEEWRRYESNEQRKWLVRVRWFPPNEWAGKKPECLPCQRVVWTQDWNWDWVLLGNVGLSTPWHTDWGVHTAYKAGPAWKAGGHNGFASFSDSPGLNMVSGLGSVFKSFRAEFISKAICTGGDDAGEVYATFIWHINWGRESDLLEASYQIGD